MKAKRDVLQSSFSVPVLPPIVIGVTLGTVFLGAVTYGPLNFDMLKRYCLGHWVCYATIELFAVGIIALILKWCIAIRQLRMASFAGNILRRIIGDGDAITPSQRIAWLSASWNSQPQSVRGSWFGGRLKHVLDRQSSRGRRHQMETDLKSIADSDADRQHDSYGLIRIINWAMPMLGFLGTVLGISQTLGTMDMELLATEQQKAMNQLTAGLYVAFDTTAIALILTVVSMFVQFAVSRMELKLLQIIDSDTNESLIGFLTVDPFDTQETLLTPVREMATELITTVRALVEEQSSIWSKSILESQRQWMEWTEKATVIVEQQMGDSVGGALSRHSSALEKLQDESTRQLDIRMQQWQTMLSDQARLVQGQQKEVIRQTETLQTQTESIQKLVESTVGLRHLEETIHESVGRLENIGRIEQASICVGEAVAVLATSMERAGLLRASPVRPRASQNGSINSPDVADKAAEAKLPSQRKAA